MDNSDHLRTRNGKALRIPAVCRTCIRCRGKKAKCDGKRPSCASCARSGHVCKYPTDTRLAKRPSRAEFDALREELVQLQQHLHDLEPVVEGSGNDGPGARAISGPASELTATVGIEPLSTEADDNTPNDTRIACAIEGDGSIHVHGVSSYLHDPAGWKAPRRRPSSSSNAVKDRLQATRDHLFANAAYQRQRETALLGCVISRRPLIDFDGIAPELAIHLLDLHWNRQHYAYLMTYRPAFFDSLANQGPYANKLLLNSLYFSSCCLDSDRPVFQTDIKEPRRRGERFYNRFKMLLMDEIDKPSLSTIVALVVVGTTLVSTGQQNAGWVLSGFAYRMIVDMGLHLSTSLWCSGAAPATNLTAIEVEMRSRIYWAAFMLDNYQSLYLGRPPYLRPADARMSRDLYDHYEELENWQPYVDPEEPSTALKSLLTGYTPRPIYAVSTFRIFTVLGEIASSITAFYAMDCLKIPVEHHLSSKRRVRADLDAWKENVPSHLCFDPRVDSTPPPNQVVPHALFHTLTILLERPFLPSGHLSSMCDADSQKHGQERCTESAFHIWRLLDAYQRAFTFRRTPYLLSYATHCAIVVLLNQDQSGDQYEECIRFFWFALLRIQKGTHFGLQKPLKILHTLMRRVGQSVPDCGLREDPCYDFQNLEASRPQMARNDAYALDLNSGVHQALPTTNQCAPDPGLEAFLQQNINLDVSPTDGWMWPMVNEYGQVDDSLIGLMNPGQPMMHGFVSW